MAETMKGYVFKDVNDLRLEDRPIPTIQDPRDAIVRVALSSICASDFHIKVGAVPSANKDIILGHEFAGEVVAVGDACKKIKVGDRVVANVETFCGECFFCELRRSPFGFLSCLSRMVSFTIISKPERKSFVKIV